VQGPLRVGGSDATTAAAPALPGSQAPGISIAGGRWPAADSFIAIALRAGLTLVRGRTRSELVGADLVIAPAIGESGWMRPTRIPAFAAAGEDALVAGLPELRRLLEA